ncbi:MAG: 3-hydroxyacyl-CoA dehydrogenase family protein [Thermomicrobiales bacterium]
MKIAMLGPGLMGAQIACEYALGGHAVVILARRPDVARERIDSGYETALRHEIVSPDAVAAARPRLRFASDIDEFGGSDIIVESVVEDLDAKVAALIPAVAAAPGAIVASNTSSIPITAIGSAIGHSARTIGAHYWNPPLLMPLVEVIRGEETSDATLATMVEVLPAIGKRPVVIDRDVDGFAWNRLQFAMLREAVWLVENGVATPDTVDTIIRDGLARRWRYTGPFQTAALGGSATFERIAANLWPVLSNAAELHDLRQWLDERPDTTCALKANRDKGLGADLRADRQASERGET